MKKRIGIILSTLLIPAVIWATVTDDAEFALNRMNSVAQKHQLGTLLAKNTNTVVCKYSYAVQGGALNSSIFLLRDLFNTTAGGRCVLPDNAVIKQAFIDVLTAPVGGSVALALQGANDILSTVSAASVTGIVAGVPVDTAASMIKLTANRSPTLLVTNSALTDGKFNVYIEYVLGD